MVLRRVLVASFVVASASAAFVACSDLSGLSGTETPDGATNDGSGNEDDATTGDASVPNDAADAGISDASVDGDAKVRCGDATIGPVMVPSGTFCIDSTEVSQADYSAFLVAKASDTSGQPSACTWNTSYAVLEECGFSGGPLPVTGIDWCDAYAYCKWVGKRLCGQIGGGSEVTTANGATSVNQWYAACSNYGANVFPYGQVYDGKKCNGEDREAGTPLNVGTSGCEGSVPGVFDLSGNVEEWTDLCFPAGDAGPQSNDQCASRGGDYGEDQSNLRCVWSVFVPRDFSACYTGFRCCADIVP